MNPVFKPIKITDLEEYKIAEGITHMDKICGTCHYYKNGHCTRMRYEYYMKEGFVVLPENEACTSWRHR